MIPYIINVALILTGCLIFYKLLLRKETFYKMNRYMLVLCLFVAFSLPLLPVPQQLSFRKTEAVASEKSSVLQTKNVPGPSKAAVDPPVIAPVQETSITPAPGSAITMRQVTNWLFWIYWFGVIIFALNFIMQLVILFIKSRRYPVIQDGRYRIVEVTGDKAPCSFGNTIFINPEKYEWDTYHQILLHEKVHIRQKHSLDILLAELMLIFQWFNPFAWVYRREIESNLEFLTDDQLTQKEAVEKTSYQLNLLKVSAPHFPLSLTTNYNQSILKKRIAMMNTKRSNLHTSWKYFFLLPLLALLACLLNEPFAQPGPKKPVVENKTHQQRSIGTEGYWFAVIKDDMVNIRFSDDDDISFENNGGSFSGTTFKLSDLSNVPKGAEGKFTITREAGTMEMTGKFDGNTGMGSYKFKADQSYVSYMNTELGEKLDEEDQMAFFFVNVKKDYLQMLKKEGFTNVDKDDLIPMAALKIDAAYIREIKDNGFKNVEMEELIPLKALGVNAAYIKEIRDAGIKDVDLDKLVSFKAQNIDKEYITKMKDLKGNEILDDGGDDLVSYKAMNIDENYLRSFKSVGIEKLPNDLAISFKALGITPEYIKSWHDHGYKDLDLDELPGLKSQNVTPEFMKTFSNLGYKNLKPEDMVSLKALGVTPEYIQSFEKIGYKIEDLDQSVGLKAQGITPEFVKTFDEFKFKDADLEAFVSAKAMGVTPDYINNMKQKGFNYDKLHKYVTLKSID